LEGIGVNARSWQGWQLPILTSNAHAAARILDINGAELVKRFQQRQEVAVIAGFQGLHADTGRITTLGRGGSDTSAVAVAASIAAERCDIYTDVDGVYTTDPRVVPRARRLDRIAYEEMLELASLGAKVMQVRSVELGMVHNVRICVRSRLSTRCASTLMPRMSFTLSPMLAVLEEADFIRAWSSSRTRRLISASFFSRSAFKGSAGEAASAWVAKLATTFSSW